MNSPPNRDIELRLLIIEEMVSSIYDAVVPEKRFCPICNQAIRLFLPFGTIPRRNARCPVCHTLERHRFLWLYLQRYTSLLKGTVSQRILHFAPEKGLSDQIKQVPKTDYFPVDADPIFPGIRHQVDIQDLSFNDCFFDYILCNHVLEHIPDDRKALAELHRVLKPKGIAFIMVPTDKSLISTYENKAHDTPELRLLHYGQEDHVRIYGKDFIERLAAFDVTTKLVSSLFSAKEIEEKALLSEDILYICTKA